MQLLCGQFYPTETRRAMIIALNQTRVSLLSSVDTTTTTTITTTIITTTTNQTFFFFDYRQNFSNFSVKEFIGTKTRHIRRKQMLLKYLLITFHINKTYKSHIHVLNFHYFYKLYIFIKIIK